jgi:spore protease
MDKEFFINQPVDNNPVNNQPRFNEQTIDNQLLLQTMAEQPQWRTDLAIDIHESLKGSGGPIPGVSETVQETPVGNVVKLVVQNPEAARRMGKAPGTYVTVEAPCLGLREKEKQNEVATILAAEIEKYLQQVSLDAPVLVVGLGNRQVTPDSLGPLVAEKILATRHLKDVVPPELRGKLRPVMSLAPGVLGTTGLETSEIVKALVKENAPALVIAIDALATNSIERLGITIQVADSGINPGSGVGNKRAALTYEALGVPVIAIGVPTVVDAITLVENAVDYMTNRGYDTGRVGQGPIDKPRIVRDILSRYFGSLFVTPRQIDSLVLDLAQVVAGGLNAALHKGIGPNEINTYLN